MIRDAVVAGTFYPDNRNQLKSQINQWWPTQPNPSPTAMAAMVPHAGYIYSGPTAAKTLSLLPKASTAIILGPNHTGRGSKCAISGAEGWMTPLGFVPVNQELACQIVDRCPVADLNNDAHASEHSIEVILPFLQFGKLATQIVPICVALWHWYELRQLSQTLGELIKYDDESILLIASSDMNHFADLKTTEQLDHLAIGKILDMQAGQLMEIVAEKDISMCGLSPMLVMMEALTDAAPVTARLIDYTTSAKLNGDQESVVGYAGILFERK